MRKAKDCVSFFGMHSINTRHIYTQRVPGICSPFTRQGARFTGISERGTPFEPARAAALLAGSQWRLRTIPPAANGCHVKQCQTCARKHAVGVDIARTVQHALCHTMPHVEQDPLLFQVCDEDALPENGFKEVLDEIKIGFKECDDVVHFMQQR